MKTIIDKKTGKEITISDESYDALFPKEKWKPLFDENYWFVDSSGGIVSDIWKNTVVDIYRYLTRNIFKTKEEAKDKLHAIKKKFEILGRIEELNEGWKPNWDNLDELKCYVYYHIQHEKWCVDYTLSIIRHPDKFYFKSKEIGKQLIDEFGNDLKYLFTL